MNLANTTVKKKGIVICTNFSPLPVVYLPLGVCVISDLLGQHPVKIDREI